MINPFSIFSFFSFLYTIAKDSPDPVNVQYEPPSPNLLPVELYKKTKIDGFFTSQIWIENLSNKVLEQVRVNLTAPLDYEPIVRTSKPHGEIEYKYIQQSHELIIEKIDPKEGVRISFFPSVESIDKFVKPQILVGNQELSKMMETLGLYKKYPSYLGLYLMTIFSVVAGICTVGLSGYVILHDNEYLFPNSDAVLLRHANERLKGYGCPQNVGVVNEKLKWKIMNTFGYPQTILQINGVKTEKELWAKEKIVYINCSE